MNFNSTSEMQPLITVAICTRNRAALLKKAVRSVLPQMNERAEILIVDNGSTDDTAGVAAEFAAADARVKFFLEPQIGLSRARNLALRQASGDWIIFLDDDAEAEPGWLSAYESFFSSLPSAKIAVVGGAVIPRYEIPPPKWMNADGRQDLGPKSFCLPASNILWECNCAWRRAAALQAGGFDAQLGHQGEVAGYHEGADLNARLQNAGYEIWWLHGAAIRHFIHANRLNLKWVLHAAFNSGFTAAIQRLKARTGCNRVFYAVGRVLIAPLHCGVNLLAGLVTFPFQGGRVAEGELVRAATIAGFACGLLPQIFRGDRANPGIRVPEDA
jgi:glycosyltransferase involved in cell wall biosynthesis